MAAGVAGLREQVGDNVVNRDMPEIHRFLDDFYISRIGIRVLIGK